MSIAATGRLVVVLVGVPMVVGVVRVGPVRDHVRCHGLVYRKLRGSRSSRPCQKERCQDEPNQSGKPAVVQGIVASVHEFGPQAT